MPFDEETERKTAKQLLEEVLAALEHEDASFDVVRTKIEQAISKIQAASCEAEAQLNRLR